MVEQESVQFAFPAVPGNNATAVIWNSVTALGANQLRAMNATLLHVMWFLLDQASAASGFKAYHSLDAGTTWRQLSIPDAGGVASMPVTVSSLAASTNAHYGFVLTPYRDFKVEWTAGATGPTASTGWEGIVTLIRGGAAVEL